MTSFNYGVSLISTQSCSSTTPDGHFHARRPGVTFVPSSGWEYLPSTGNSTGGPQTSFDTFTQEQAILILKNNQDFIDYINKHTDPYVISGHCTANGDGGVPVGTLVWNLTFGEKGQKEGSQEGLNVIVTQDGQVKSKKIKIDNPPNSTADFDPLLTFGNSEDIFYEYSGEIQNIPMRK